MVLGVLQCGRVIVWGSGGNRELRYGGVVVWKSFGEKELQCVGVAVCGYCVVGEL